MIHQPKMKKKKTLTDVHTHQADILLVNFVNKY